jgi:hypothetical protein
MLSSLIQSHHLPVCHQQPKMVSISFINPSCHHGCISLHFKFKLRGHQTTPRMPPMRSQQIEAIKRACSDQSQQVA